MAHTVLVADDSKTIRQIVGMALKASPYQLLEASSARATLEAIQRSGPDVILLDYHMPDGSGYEICRRLKANASTSRIPVIMLGGTYKNFDESAARQAGADEVIWKPFKTDQLLGAIESALSRPAPAPTPAPAPARAPSSSGAPMPPPNPFSAGRSGAPDLSSPGVQPHRQAPTSGSQPRIPTPTPHPAARNPLRQTGSQPRINPEPPRPAQNAAPAPAASAGPGVDRAELEGMIRDEVKRAVREELPGLLRNVMGDLFQQKILPRLVKHSEQKVNQVLNEQLSQRVTEQVRVELERLLGDE